MAPMPTASRITSSGATTRSRTARPRSAASAAVWISAFALPTTRSAVSAISARTAAVVDRETSPTARRAASSTRSGSACIAAGTSTAAFSNTPARAMKITVGSSADNWRSPIRRHASARASSSRPSTAAALSKRVLASGFTAWSRSRALGRRVSRLRQNPSRI